MQLIMDIDDAVLNRSRNVPLGKLIAEHGEIVKLIPEDHGRIIDESQITVFEWDGKRMICNAPTILDADMRGTE